jgi:isoamylase
LWFVLAECLEGRTPFLRPRRRHQPSRIIPINPGPNRTYHYWHTFVSGAEAGQIYGYRVYGPFEPSLGFRFDSSKVLLDPYARSIVVPKNYSRAAAEVPGDNAATAMKSVVGFNWL